MVWDGKEVFLKKGPTELDLEGSINVQMDKGENFLGEREKPGKGSGRVTPPTEIQISPL